MQRCLPTKYLFIYIYIYLFICLFIYIYIFLNIYIYICICVCLCVCNARTYCSSWLLIPLLERNHSECLKLIYHICHKFQKSSQHHFIFRHTDAPGRDSSCHSGKRAVLRWRANCHWLAFLRAQGNGKNQDQWIKKSSIAQIFSLWSMSAVCVKKDTNKYLSISIYK